MPNSASTSPNDLPTIPLDPLHAASDSRNRPAFLDAPLLFRSRRRRLIRKIEAATGRTLLCYVARSHITQSDPFDLIRLLDEIDSGTPITLLLDSPGGLIDPAEKMVHLLREACESPSNVGDFEIVVPYQAKSAATLMALGADRILMSDSSELGPIDPQIPYANGVWVSVFALLRAYEKAERRCREHPTTEIFATELSKFEPVILEELRRSVSRARTCAENLLKRQGGNYTAVPDRLMDIDRFPSHGQMIDWRTAKEIGIPHVHHLPRHSSLWRLYWDLFRQLAHACGRRRRIFESRSLTILKR